MVMKVYILNFQIDEKFQMKIDCVVRAVCLFVWSFSSHSFRDFAIAGEELQILTYARHLWPLGIEGFLAYHTYCDTGHPFIVVISEDMCHSQLLPSV